MFFRSLARKALENHKCRSVLKSDVWWRHPVVSALKCVCQLCANNTCETGADGACWNSVMLINGKEEAVKSCLSPAEMRGQVFCYSSRNVSKRNCCFTDFCNNETLHLHPGTYEVMLLIAKSIVLLLESIAQSLWFSLSGIEPHGFETQTHVP